MATVLSCPNSGCRLDTWKTGGSATAGVVLEAGEEIGVLVKTDNFRLVHVVRQHASSGRIALSFEATDWSGEITNCEPDKRLGWMFVDPADPPAEIVPYIAHALRHIDVGEVYSERGWS